MNHTFAIGIFGVGQGQHTVANGPDSFVAWLARLGEVIENQGLQHWRVDGLPDSLVMPTGKEDDVVIIQREPRGRPGQRSLALLRSLHLVVKRDG